MLPPRITQVLSNNATFASTYPSSRIPTMTQMRARSLAEQQGLVVLTCLDPRTVPEQFFGPDLRAGVIRNAGGRAGGDAISSIVLLRSLMDVKTVAVVHHTGSSLPSFLLSFVLYSRGSIMDRVMCAGVLYIQIHIHIHIQRQYKRDSQS